MTKVPPEWIAEIEAMGLEVEVLDIEDDDGQAIRVIEVRDGDEAIQIRIGQDGLDFSAEMITTGPKPRTASGE